MAVARDDFTPGKSDARASARTRDEWRTPALIIEEGAIFQGNCVMGEKKPANVTNIAAKG